MTTLNSSIVFESWYVVNSTIWPKRLAGNKSNTITSQKGKHFAIRGRGRRRHFSISSHLPVRPWTHKIAQPNEDTEVAFNVDKVYSTDSSLKTRELACIKRGLSPVHGFGNKLLQVPYPARLAETRELNGRLGKPRLLVGDIKAIQLMDDGENHGN